MASHKNSLKANVCSKEWVMSSSIQENLTERVMDGILQDKAMARWRPTQGDLFLNPCDGELVMFEDFY